MNLEADRLENKLDTKIMNRSHSFWSLGFFASGITGALFSQMQISPFINFSLSLVICSIFTFLFCARYKPASKRENPSKSNNVFVYDTKLDKFYHSVLLPINNNCPMVYIHKDYIYLLGGEGGSGCALGQVYGQHLTMFLRARITISPEHET